MTIVKYTAAAPLWQYNHYAYGQHATAKIVRTTEIN